MQQDDEVGLFCSHAASLERQQCQHCNGSFCSNCQMAHKELVKLETLKRANLAKKRLFLLDIEFEKRHSSLSNDVEKVRLGQIADKAKSLKVALEQVRPLGKLSLDELCSVRRQLLLIDDQTQCCLEMVQPFASCTPLPVEETQNASPESQVEDECQGRVDKVRRHLATISDEMFSVAENAIEFQLGKMKQQVNLACRKIEEAVKKLIDERRNKVFELADKVASEQRSRLEELGSKLEQMSVSTDNKTLKIEKIQEIEEEADSLENVAIEMANFQFAFDDSKFIPKEAIQQIGTLQLDGVLNWNQQQPLSNGTKSAIEEIVPKLHPAMESGNLPLLKQLLSPFALATEAIKRIFEVRVGEEGCTILHMAAYFGSLDIVKYFVEELGANTSVKTTFHENTTAISAAINGHIQVLDYLISREPSLAKIGNNKGSTVLAVAVTFGRIAVIEFLASKGLLDVNEVYGDKKFTPLHTAVFSRQLEAVGTLLKYGADPTVGDSGKTTPLHLAAGSGVAEMLQLMLRSKNILLNSTDSLGRTALHVAAIANDVPAVQLLLENGAQIDVVDDEGCQPIHQAVNCGSTNVVHYLLQHKTDLVCAKDKNGVMVIQKIPSLLGPSNAFALPRCPEYNPRLLEETLPKLHPTVADGNLELLKHLLSPFSHSSEARRRVFDIRVEDEGYTILHRAAYFGMIDIVKYFIEDLRADIFVKTTGHGDNAAHKAVVGGHFAVLDWLLSREPSLATLGNHSGRTVIHTAASIGRVDVIHLLVNQYLADVNQHNKKQYRPLHCAAMSNQRQAAEALLNHGADHKARDSDGNTPLHTAAFNGSCDVLQLLLKESTIDLNSANYQGRTALHCAAIGNKVQVVKLLLENGAKVDITDKKGHQPIHVAAYNNSTDVIQYLLQCKPDLAYVTEVFEWAIKSGQASLIQQCSKFIN